MSFSCVQEILNYLGQFQDLSGKATTEGRLPHPCDTVIEKFQNPETAAMTWSQIISFLTEWQGPAGTAAKPGPVPVNAFPWFPEVES